jgi:hypothetical protein
MAADPTRAPSGVGGLQSALAEACPGLFKEPSFIALLLIAVISESLPLMGAKYKGLLHAMKCIIQRMVGAPLSPACADKSPAEPAETKTEPAVVQSVVPSSESKQTVAT